MIRRSLLLGPACLLVLLLIACGSSGAGAGDIAKTATGFYQAMSNDPPNAYTYLSDDCRSQIGYLDFVATINQFQGFIGKGKLKVEHVKITDQTSTHITADYDVVLESGEETIPLAGQLDPEGPTNFVKEHGRWRFEDCAGLPKGGSSETTEPPATPPAGAIATPTFVPGSPAAIEADDDPSLPGDFVDLQKIYGGYWGNRDGNNTAPHEQTSIDYSVQGELPPAGGPHWGAGRCPGDPVSAPFFCGPVPWGIYRDPWPAESVVHNMEHAGVVIWYNTSDRAVIDKIEAIATKNLNNGKFIVVTPYPEMEQDEVALTAWGRREKFSVGDYSDDRVQEFIDKLECRFDPERLCGSKPQPTPLSPGSV